MAIDPQSQYPGQVTGSSAEYPYGSAVNVTAPGAGDGTPWEEVGLNDLWGFHQALLVNAAITPNSAAETVLASQYLQAVQVIGQSALPNKRPTIENESVTPATKLQFNPGIIWDSTGTFPIRLTAALVKQTNANWVAGDDVGGFPSGLTLTASTKYHAFWIAKADGTVDAGFDTSLTAANLLADATGYVFYARISTIFVDVSIDIELFVQRQLAGRLHTYWKAQAQDWSQGATIVSGTEYLATLRIPTDVLVEVMLDYVIDIAQADLSGIVANVASTLKPYQASGFAFNNIAIGFADLTPTTGATVANILTEDGQVSTCLTATGGTIATTTMGISTIGWIE